MVTRYMIQVKACGLTKKLSYQTEYSSIEKVRFSQKWVDSFMSRHKREHDYLLALIGNMDETPISFNLLYNTIIEQAGTKTILILIIGHERSNFMVVLAYMANRTKLPPVIIFKLKKISREEFPDGIIIHTNPEGWINKNEML
ncbi:pogo transposable element with KRAB domain [Rhizophagus clarus]|uniref:Pogo transposable element with KRAB domain n=1 Tax=Rhizophagus clarus TaxID=94130 RepID=A0A8H3R538_9GLOM|nr:pogo transposable element with KRAB domain [Rhizophagus clarus]